MADDDIRMEPTSSFDEVSMRSSSPGSKSILDVQVLTDDPPLFCKALLNGFAAGLSFRIVV